MSTAELDAIARKRVERATKEILRSVACAREGNPLAAEPNDTRLENRLRAKALLSSQEAEAISLGIRAWSKADPKERETLTKGFRPEAIYGQTIDFLGVSFLERGVSAARSVARVAFRDGRAQGSGFMVSDQLFLTNHHVIESAALAAQFCLEFEYELDSMDRPRNVSKFALRPDLFFASDGVRGLDFTLIAVGARLSGPRSLGDFGYCGITDAQDKHALGEVANIVQHPDGRYKEVVLRENRLAARLDYVLHYVADTQPGSSGSPVFNNEWQPIALHHWGTPWRQTTNDQGRRLPSNVNEGIRVSAVVGQLRSRLSSLAPAQKALLNRALELSEAADYASRAGSSGVVDGASATDARMEKDGSVTWRIPIEISVRLPDMAASTARAAVPASAQAVLPTAVREEAKVRPTTDYGNRGGYKPKFISGFTIEMPRLSSAQHKDAARNLQAEAGDDPHELKYHHFSVVMNRKRRLAFFTACNIDGRNAKAVDRDTGVVTDLDPNDPHLAERLAESEGAEASETWYDDERLDPDEYAGSDAYADQIVPGYLNKKSMARTLRMFQRGHLVRRMDPAWGSVNMARLADADTFHWTNCSPQVGFFNMGRGAANAPKSGGGKLWRAVENYVLRNAAAENLRVCSFTGPVFGQNDRKFRDLQVPGRFWKIVVWAEGGELRSLAMIADQRPVISVWPESLGESAGSEAYGDDDELSRVEDFLTTIAELEALTKLDFGDTVREADIRAGGSLEKIADEESIPLRPGRGSRRSAGPNARQAGRAAKKRNGALRAEH